MKTSISIPYPAQQRLRLGMSMLLLSGALLYATGVFAQDKAPTAASQGHTNADQQHQLRANRGSPAAQQQQQQGKSKIDNGDSTLMRRMAESHFGEIRLAALALEISTDAKVRNFAQTLLDDHYAALDQLRKLAGDKGVVLPGGPDTEGAAKATQLARLTGDEFNRQFMASAGTEAHDKAAKLFDEAKGKAKDEDLQAYVAKTGPVVAQHLKLAQQLQGTPPQASAQ